MAGQSPSDVHVIDLISADPEAQSVRLPDEHEDEESANLPAVYLSLSPGVNGTKQFFFVTDSPGKVMCGFVPSKFFHGGLIFKSKDEDYPSRTVACTLPGLIRNIRLEITC